MHSKSLTIQIDIIFLKKRGDSLFMLSIKLFKTINVYTQGVIIQFPQKGFNTIPIFSSKRFNNMLFKIIFKTLHLQHDYKSLYLIKKIKPMPMEFKNSPPYLMFS